MHTPYNEIILKTSSLGISIAFYTGQGGYRPFHWHEALEILYPLNGKSDVYIIVISYHLKNKQFIVIDSQKIHSTYHYEDSAMILCIHIIKKALSYYFPKILDYHIQCCPDDITDSKFADYLEMNQFLQRITELYIKGSPTFLLESEGLVLQMLSRLIQCFASDSAPLLSAANKMAMDRIRQVIDYTETHYKEPISLQDAAGLLNIGKEYFCRFFKKNMGTSFFQYVNQVRAAHIYQDLVYTDMPVGIIMEQNGFTNQKLCNRIFKELYGCTPSQIRRSAYNALSSH